MLELIPALSSLGGTVVIAGMMLWYMKGRDVQTKELANNGHAAIRELTKVVSGLNTKIVLQSEKMENVCRAKE